ncbi:MAG: transglycosylase SLT domain-containing protein [Alcanivorax sp.]|nr:transglycosylase SLT domain-containing protein [Alcanivorax sp.]
MILRVALLLAVAALAGCAGTPTNTDDACAVFDQRGGWFNNWYKYAKKTEKEYGVPVPVLMATVYKESGFDAHAKPPRTRLLGFIPWKRPSSAYGYAQALTSTWASYQNATGRHGADRDDFQDAVRFIGWYYYQSYKINGIARNDTYHLYLSYYSGHGGYARGTWKHNKWVQGAARRTAAMAKRYQQQLRHCGR